MRAFILCLFLFITCILQAQTYPVNQSVGNTPATLVTTNSIRANQGVILGSFADTAAANLLPYLKNYPGAMIYTTGDGSIWVRNPMASGWIDIGGGITPSGSFWRVGGNLFPVTAPTRNIGTLQPYGGAIGLMTNSNVHLILSDTGLFRNQSVDDSVLVKNTLGEFGVYPKSAFSGGSYTFPYSVVAPGDAIQLENDTSATVANYVYGTNSVGRRTWLPQSGLRPYTFNNGLTESGGTVKLGGTLSEHTTIDADGSDFTFSDVQFFTITVNDIITLNGELSHSGTVSEFTSSQSGRTSVIRNRADSISFLPSLGILNIDSLRSATDTTTRKPMVWSPATGRWEYLTYWPGGGGSTPISSLTAATGTNTIDNGAFQQNWQWNTLASGVGLNLTSTSTDFNGGSVLAITTSGVNASSDITVLGQVITINNSGAGASVNYGLQSNATGAETNYGGAFTATGATTMNIAGVFTATGATTNYAARFRMGTVSFGTAGTETAKLELNGGASGTVTIQPAAAAGTYTLTLPTNDGDANQFLQTNGSGVLSWADGGGMTNPMTTEGDIIVGGASGTPTRLGIGTNGYVIKSNGTTASWQPDAGGSVSFGLVNEIPYTNSSTDDFNYSSNFTFNGTTLYVNGGAVFNDGAGNNDFRVESSTVSNMLHVDADADRFYITGNVYWSSAGDEFVYDRVKTYSYSSNVYGGWHPVQGGFMVAPNAGYNFTNANNFNTVDAVLSRESAGVIRAYATSALSPSGWASITSKYDRFGTGSPESAVTADVSSIYHRTDGGTGTSLYVKESGSGNTGWDAVVGAASTQTLTNKRITKRITSEASSATPTINTDNADIHKITALATDITSMTTNLSGSPNEGDDLEIWITGTATRNITWGASFVAGSSTPPTATNGTATLKTVWNRNSSAWVFKVMY